MERTSSAEQANFSESGNAQVESPKEKTEFMDEIDKDVASPGVIVSAAGAEEVATYSDPLENSCEKLVIEPMDTCMMMGENSVAKIGHASITDMPPETSPAPSKVSTQSYSATV